VQIPVPLDNEMMRPYTVGPIKNPI
jgi:hypothetical protein